MYILTSFRQLNEWRGDVSLRSGVFPGPVLYRAPILRHYAFASPKTETTITEPDSACYPTEDSLKRPGEILAGPGNANKH